MRCYVAVPVYAEHGTVGVEAVFFFFHATC